MTTTESIGRPRAPAYRLASDTPAEIAADLARLVAESSALRASLAKDLGSETMLEHRTHHAAHALHLRRQLEAAAEHGAALLAALGLPRLVGPDHIVVDPAVAGDALDQAIATLDALDSDADLEEDDPAEAEPDEWSLGWPEDVAACVNVACAADPDAELDDADLEDDERDTPPPSLTSAPAGRRAVFGAFDGEEARG